MREPLAESQAQEQLSRFRYELSSGFFETVVEQGQKILKDSETRPPADAALYAMGEAYADHAFTGRDYTLSRQYFEKLIRNFPHSPLASEARTFLGLYEAIAVRDRTIAGLLEQSTRAPAKKPAAPRRPVVEKQDFEKAARKNEQILRKAGAAPPADEALYNLGLVYAHIDNPTKDYQKAQEYFSRLAREFPASPLAEQARAWLGLFGVFEKMREIDLDIEEQKKQLNR